MPREILYKTAAEALDHTIDFVAEIPSGGAISSIAITAVNSAGTSDTATIVDTANSGFSGSVVTVVLKASSTDKETYTVVVAVTMDDTPATVRVKVLDVRIRDTITVE